MVVQICYDGPWTIETTTRSMNFLFCHAVKRMTCCFQIFFYVATDRFDRGKYLHRPQRWALTDLVSRSVRKRGTAKQKQSPLSGLALNKRALVSFPDLKFEDSLSRFVLCMRLIFVGAARVFVHGALISYNSNVNILHFSTSDFCLLILGKELEDMTLIETSPKPPVVRRRLSAPPDT